MALSIRNIQDPTYVARQDANLGDIAAGAAGQSQKFIAFSALRLYSVTGVLRTVGTSTYTVGGTATINAQQASVIVIQNTATQGQTAQLSTQTYGPFLFGGQFGTATGTGQAFAGNQFALNTTAPPGGYGGILVAPFSTIYVVTGTDATAASSYSLEYAIDTSAGMTL